MEADAEHLAAHSQAWKSTVFDKSNPFGVPAKYAHLIVVSVHHYKLYYYERGVVVRVFDCVTDGRRCRPLSGRYQIYAKDPHIGGPYGPYRMRYLGLFAIHGTNEPWLLGRYPRNFSHGCTGSRTRTSPGCTPVSPSGRRSGTCRELRPRRGRAERRTSGPRRVVLVRASCRAHASREDAALASDRFVTVALT